MGEQPQLEILPLWVVLVRNNSFWLKFLIKKSLSVHKELGNKRGTNRSLSQNKLAFGFFFQAGFIPHTFCGLFVCQAA